MIWHGLTWVDLARGVLVVAAGIMTISANWDYFREVRADIDAAKPRVVSWVIWTGGTLIGAGQAFRAGLGQIPGVCYDAACAAGCAAIVAAAWRRGNREISRLDRVCLRLGGVALAFLAASVPWPALIPLAAAVALSVAADVIAYTPTFKHGWKKPGEEPWRPYAKFTLGAALTMAALLYTDVTRGVPLHRAAAGAIYPAYLLLANAVMVFIVLASPHRHPLMRLPLQQDGPRHPRSGRRRGHQSLIIRRAGQAPRGAGVPAGQVRRADDRHYCAGCRPAQW